MFKRIVATILPLFLSTQVLAFNKDATVVGYGNLPCTKWTEMRKVNDEASKLFKIWVAGYISAFNAWNAEGGEPKFTAEQKKMADKIPIIKKHQDQLRNLTSAESAENIFSYVDIYCRENPEAPISYAVDYTVMQAVMKINERFSKEVDEDFSKDMDNIIKGVK